MIKIGTSGFDYDNWREIFYPGDLPKEQFLSYYSDHFNALELNFSYHTIPSPRQLDSMLKCTDGKVEFALQLHKSMTHDRIASRADIEQFTAAIEPLRDAKKLGAVIAQFPYSFNLTEENRAYLKHLADDIGPPLVVEFGHADWATTSILLWLKQIGVGYCCVDEPKIKGLMPPIASATASPAYVRFHGRNASQWYEHNQPHERYDYRYNARELSGWVAKIKQLENDVGKVMIFFKNHFQAKAVDGAQTFRRLLGVN